MKSMIALGIYQSMEAARMVAGCLRKEGNLSYVVIHRGHDNKLTYQNRFHIPFFFYEKGISKHVVARFSPLVCKGETFILVHVAEKEATHVMDVLMQTAAGESVTFLFRKSQDAETDGILSSVLPFEGLQEEAVKLAKSLKQKKLAYSRDSRLLIRLKETKSILSCIHQELINSDKLGQASTLSVNWILDNYYLIRGHIEDVLRNLPKAYYRELPKIEYEGSYQPRAYVMGRELIRNTDGKITQENVIGFLKAFQTIVPLTIGELWALPLLLRLGLIEMLRSLVLKINHRQLDGEKARFWGNRLLLAMHKHPGTAQKLMKRLQDSQENPSPHFAQELLDHLFDEDQLLVTVRDWFEKKFNKSIVEVLQHEQLLETSEQISISNCILSLMTLSQLDWRAIFKQISVVDEILMRDPAGIYPQIDFRTSDLYRRPIERIARAAKIPEVEVAEAAIALAADGETFLQKHVGYYLVDEGLLDLEKRFGYIPGLKQRIQRLILKYPAPIYLGSIIFWTIVFEAILIYSLERNSLSLPLTALIAFLAVIPVSEFVIQCVNFIITLILPPFTLPKLYFQNGVPENLRTLVVIPMLLTKDSLEDQLYNLETHFLANSDPQLRFALFTDFTDHGNPVKKEDEELLKLAQDGIQGLNKKYGDGKFFLFHRPRYWSESEQAYIGWERKRGKLEELNQYLLELPTPKEPALLSAGAPKDLSGIRYVLTLDADTQLPKDRAIRLIETLSHPLNQAVMENGKVVRGYAIIQPRVSTSLPSANQTYLSRIFSGAIGTDPYTQSVSDVYQDLVHEGSYHGKGLYDLHVFATVLDKRFPEAHILSHDLLEGAYVRVGYASGIELFDEFPKNFAAYGKREKRWIRGDWQIIDWLLPYVPTAQGSEKNPINSIDRWKIFHNLLRSLLPVSLFLLVSSAAFITGVSFFAIAIAWTILLFPALVLVLFRIFSPPQELVLGSNQIRNNFFKGLIQASLIPYQAYMSLDAIGRVFYRKFISGRNLLEWNGNGRCVLLPAVIKYGAPLAAAIVLVWLMISKRWNPLFDAGAFLTLWALSPWLINFLDQPIPSSEKPLSKNDANILRKIARRTWRYFDDFVTEEGQWLPPDNYQEKLNQEVAYRTSPTNIGFYLLSVYSAYDFGFITCEEALDRTRKTLGTLEKLERFEGHFLNWYEIQGLQPLLPKYVSTVDSGNFLACLWALSAALTDLTTADILPENVWEGLRATFFELNESPNVQIAYQMEQVHAILKQKPKDRLHLVKELQELGKAAEHLNELLADEENFYWARKFIEQVKGFNQIIDRYLAWIPLLDHAKLQIILSQVISYRNLADGSLLNGIEASKEFQDARWYAGEKLAEIHRCQSLLNRFSDEMNMAFLYNPQRKVFAIGYNVTDRRLDNSYYDLLASEARLSSLVAIAKNEAPVDHWWSLGRPFATAESQKVLLSWGGTMFEYLMPILLTKNYEKSLLDNACKAAVKCQIAYGERRGIPWGISESAYSVVDSRKTYQYRSFGVPRLGLKRGLEDDLVVSPYSTAMALQIDKNEALKNLKTFMHQLHHPMLGDYGFYESIDYTREYGPHGQRGVAIYAYMAHHQGMSLLAINNCLNDNIMQKRFHSDPRVSSVESLLYERLPVSVPMTREFARQGPIRRLRPFTSEATVQQIETTETLYPKVNLLTNGKYALMSTHAGGGYSRYGKYNLTRWSADPLNENLGMFFYIKDLENGIYWSTTYQPTRKKPDFYQVKFTPDKARFIRRDHGIETVMDIVVSPEDNVEIRRLTFANLSQRQRHLEVTTYAELTLAPHNADRAHPLFNKMFIQTEVSTNPAGLMAYRRLRSETEQPLFAGQLLASSSASILTQFETDRKRFIGRGRSLENPEALDRNLFNTEGCVLDPIFSLRKQLILAPGERIELALVTVAGEIKESVLALMDKYKDLQLCTRAIDMAWTQSQLQLRYLRIKQEEAQYFQKLAARIFFPQKQTLPSVERVKRNKLNQAHLWPYGISGDLPILSVTIGNLNDLDVVRELLIAHAFLSMRGLQFDLVLLNEEGTAYDQPLNDQIFHLMQNHENYYRTQDSGRVYLLTMDQIPEQDLNLMISASRVFLVAARGSLRQQLTSQTQTPKYPPYLKIKGNIEDSPSPSLPFMELTYFNGLGGFTPDGSEYVIYLGPNQSTPSPWINVISNPSFGMLVSENGLGACWYRNSQTNRLVPWSNDNLIDPICDAVYIRDNELGTYWTPTPGPIRELDPYRIRHGQGYSTFEHNSHGIEQTLTVFVPVDEHGGSPLRIQRLTLKNASNRKRDISLMSYSELVLGENRETSQYFTTAEWDYESQAIFARNYYKQDFGGRVAFAAAGPASRFYTVDRKEFLGRNQSRRDPLALKRVHLSNQSESVLDACSVLQVDLTLEPNEVREVIFLLGQGQDPDEARRLIRKFRDSDAVEKSLQTSMQWWRKFLHTIQVETPALSANYLVNHWLLYQNLSCRIWGRTAFYQSSGAFGFRDQLQDVMATLYALPHVSREQILRAAEHQFIEGDVQHWWHPVTNGGIRTRMTDDLLWLPFVAAQYIRVTGDVSILHEQVSFLNGPLLGEHEHETYFVPEVTHEKATILEHCRRAIRKGTTSGPHGLPLIGTGDWNDGLNRVGIEGKGESVWLAWFLSHVLNDFVELLKWANDPEDPQPYLLKSKELKETIEKEAWDGDWYLRAFFDDGTPIGSKKSQEATIDSLSQSWSVISQGTRPERSEMALNAVKKRLLDQENRMLMLLTPPFDHMKEDPGYIKGYPPGIRENGAQYTHGSLWVPLAFARLGKADEAVEILQIMNPIERVKDERDAWSYKVEPYAIAADVYSNPMHKGMGGWTWYTGSAGWMYRIWLEEILGFKLRGETLYIHPALPKDWKECKIHYRYKDTLYHITITGKPLEIPLVNDGGEHSIG